MVKIVDLVFEIFYLSMALAGLFGIIFLFEPAIDTLLNLIRSHNWNFLLWIKNLLIIIIPLCFVFFGIKFFRECEGF